VEKPVGTYRIFVLGESAAMGDPDPAYGFSRYLAAMLGERFPTMRFEVVNTGIVAINSHVSLVMARELAKYKPDLLLVYTGSNEVVGPYGPGTVLTASSMSMPIIFARSLRIGQLLSEKGKQRAEWRGMEMFLNKQVPADSPMMEPAYRHFDLKKHCSQMHLLCRMDASPVAQPKTFPDRDLCSKELVTPDPQLRAA
jgi:hypothetical protein